MQRGISRWVVTSAITAAALLESCSQTIPITKRQAARLERYDAYAGKPINQFTWLTHYHRWTALAPHKLAFWTNIHGLSHHGVRALHQSAPRQRYRGDQPCRRGPGAFRFRRRPRVSLHDRHDPTDRLPAHAARSAQEEGIDRAAAPDRATGAPVPSGRRGRPTLAARREDARRRAPAP